jgi:hypothetical protein
MKPWPAAAFLFLFALTRIGLWQLGLRPDPVIILNHWQHADLAYLAADPVAAVWHFHAQPPLWNGLLALAVLVAGNDAPAATGVIHAGLVAGSALCGLVFLWLLARARIGAAMATGLALLAVCQPSVVYYENFAFYPHLTFILVTLLLAAMVRLSDGGGLGWLALALSALVALAWTWAVFHPVLVAGFGLGLVLVARAGRRGVVLLAAAVMVAGLPTLRNLVTVGYPAASSWVGLNIAQTAPDRPEAFVQRCGFVEAHREIYVSPPLVRPDLHPSLTDKVKSSGFENMNHIGLVGRSVECLAGARALIAANPARWLYGRWHEFLRSHQVFAYNYFFDPAGWQVAAPLERLQALAGAPGRWAVMAHYAALAAFAAWRAVQGPSRGLHALIFSFIAAFTLVTLFGNGGEQERMRLTIEPLYLFLLTGLAGHLLRGLGRLGRLRGLWRQ